MSDSDRLAKIEDDLRDLCDRWDKCTSVGQIMAWGIDFIVALRAYDVLLEGAANRDTKVHEWIMEYHSKLDGLLEPEWQNMLTNLAHQNQLQEIKMLAAQSGRNAPNRAIHVAHL
ncbi:hypothetical protein BD779DRAFT_1475361 [Infundibulicybe gibba]|nr:hypothetical protein BD779DRAFT_1475361 [Infundibulicybe gibba]